MPVERLPVVLASGFIADPGPEIGPLGVRVIVLVILAVISVALLVPLAIRGLPPVVDIDVVVVLLAAVPLLLVFRIVLLAPLRGLRLAVSLGATQFAILEVTSGVVILPVLIPVVRSTLVGQDRRSHEHHCRQQPQEQHQPSQLFLLSQCKSLLYFPTVRAKNLLSIGAVLLGKTRHVRCTTDAYEPLAMNYAMNSWRSSENFPSTSFGE
jgi:hypothetical protein